MRARLLIAVALAGLCAGIASAATSFEQIAVANVAIGFTTAAITPPGEPQKQEARCRARTAEMSITYDGTTPTTTVGTLLEPGDLLTVTGHARLVNFRAIRTGATSGQLDCNYEP